MDNERPVMHVSWLSQGLLKSVFFSNSYFFVAILIHHYKSSILRLFSKLYQFKCGKSCHQH